MKLFDKSNDKVYFTLVPNIIDDLELSPYAVRLYLHLKRVAGENGECWQSSINIAKVCRMGQATVSRAKKELLDKKLITITRVASKRGKQSHTISINDIWLENTERYAEKPIISPQEIIKSPVEIIISQGEIKNNPIRKTINNNLINEPNFYSLFQSIAGPVMGNTQIEDLKELKETYGDERVLEITRWLCEDRGETSMFKILKAINTAAPNWDKKPKNERDAMMEWLETPETEAINGK